MKYRLVFIFIIFRICSFKFSEYISINIAVIEVGSTFIKPFTKAASLDYCCCCFLMKACLFGQNTHFHCAMVYHCGSETWNVDGTCRQSWHNDSVLDSYIRCLWTWRHTIVFDKGFKKQCLTYVAVLAVDEWCLLMQCPLGLKLMGVKLKYVSLSFTH